MRITESWIRENKEDLYWACESENMQGWKAIITRGENNEIIVSSAAGSVGAGPDFQAGDFLIVDYFCLGDEILLEGWGYTEERNGEEVFISDDGNIFTLDEARENCKENGDFTNYFDLFSEKLVAQLENDRAES